MDGCFNSFLSALAGKSHSGLILTHFTFIYSGSLCKLADIDSINIIEERLKVISVFYYHLFKIIRQVTILLYIIILGFLDNSRNLCSLIGQNVRSCLLDISL